MLPVEWIVFLIAFSANLLMALKGERKFSIMSMLLLIIGATVVGVVLAFIDALITQATFTLKIENLVKYLFDAFVGAIIIPVAQYLSAFKVS